MRSAVDFGTLLASAAMQIDTGTELLRASVDGPIGRLTFNDPARHNVLALAMQEAIPGVVEAWEADPTVRVIVIEGAGGRAFVAGADISEFGARRTAPAGPGRLRQAVRCGVAGVAARDEAGHRQDRRVLHRRWPADGAAGRHPHLLRAEHVRRAGRPPRPRLRLRRRPPDDATSVNPAIASEILFSARRFSSAEALNVGLVNRVVAVDDLEAAVVELAGQIARNAPLTIAACKAAIRLAAEGGPDADTSEVDALAEACFRSEDYLEGQAAFLAKREPEFRGV